MSLPSHPICSLKVPPIGNGFNLLYWATIGMTVAEHQIALAVDRPLPRDWRRHAHNSVRFVVAVVIAAIITFAIGSSLPRQLATRTDIVGYPIHSDYNIELVTFVYFLIVIVFPLVSLLLYIGLGEVSRMLGLPRSSCSRPLPSMEARADPVPGKGRAVLAGAARALTVGVCFGIEAAVARNARMASSWLTIAFVALTYAGIVLGLAFVLHMTVLRSRKPMAIAAAVNALSAPFAVTGLLVVSAVTTVSVTANGSVHHYPWLPAWVALMATALLLLWIGIRVVRAPDDAICRAERAVVLFVATPICLFVVTSALPGALGPINMYEDGQNLVGAQLTLQGHVPWRDALPDHGLLQDQLSSIPGFVFFGDSFWGASAGRTLLLSPLTFVLLFVFFAVVFERSWAAVVAFVAIMLAGVLSAVHPGEAASFPLLTPIVDTRFMFWPLVLVLMKLALDHTSRWPTALLGAVLVAWVVFVPEALYGLAAVGTVFILRDFRLLGQGNSPVAAFSRTLWLIGGGATLATVVAAYLLLEGALGDFFQYYVNNLLGHELMGGLPVDPRSWFRDPYFALAAIAPVVAVLLSYWYFAAALLRGGNLLTLDWVMAAAGILTLLYYTKFLTRADLHVLYSYAVAVPLIGLLFFQIWRAAERGLGQMRPGAWLTRRVTLHPIALLLLIAILFGAGRSLLDRLPLVATQVRAQAPKEPVMSRIGYSTATPDLGTLADLDAVLRAYLRPGDWVFDFSNDPTFYYYLLQREPRTKYSSVAWAISEVAQKDLISELKRDRPKLVVFTSDRYGLTEWDGIPNMVRHYDVSQYILDNYRPLLSIRGQILYADASATLSSALATSLRLGETPVTEDLPFRGLPCDWGAAPNFLRVSPPSRDRGLPPVTLTGQMSDTVFATVSGWAVDPNPGASLREVVIVAGDRVVGRGMTSLERPDVAAALHDPLAARSGFQIEVSDGPPTERKPASPFHVFGISTSGVATELRYGPAARPPLTEDGKTLTRLDLGDGTAVPVQPEVVEGFVDNVTGSYIEISPPANTAWADYRWMEIDARDSGIKPDVWTISDRLVSGPQRQVTFRTLSGSPKTFMVYVGSCAQWHGYANAPLYVTHEQSQEITAIRLLP
jgi:hypothetical protein